MINLEVIIDPDAGFCFGVTNAIAQAQSILEQNDEIYCVGELVHNQEEVSRLEKMGLRIVKSEDLKDLKGKTVLFRAHGEPPQNYKLIEQNGNTLVDATCPIVVNLQQRVKGAFDRGENVYIFGQVEHPEIVGIIGQIDNKARVFNSTQELEGEKMPDKITLYSQTTKNAEMFNDVIKYFEDRGVEVLTGNKVCSQVANRKDSLITFCKGVDRMIFVAGKNSANGVSLYKACKEVQPKTEFISTAVDLEGLNFEPNQRVGISGATSTPLWLINEIAEVLKKY